MKAIQVEEINGPFRLCEVPDPVSESGKVLIRLKAAALNHRDVFIRRGQYAGLKFPFIPGSDGTGIRMDTNMPVIVNPSQRWGDLQSHQSSDFRILGLPDAGTFAEKISVSEDYVYPLPGHLDFLQGAALPLAGLTAWRALFRRGALQKNESVLITGIGGGVALLGLQFAIAAGAKVYVTSGSEAKISRAREMGAAGGQLYHDAEWPAKLKKEAGGFDLILDGTGGEGAAHFADLANPGGRIVLYGGTRGAIPNLSPQRIFWKQLSILGSTMGSDRDFSEMLEFVSRNRIVPILDSVYPLADAELAVTRMEQSAQFGKIVLSMDANAASEKFNI